MPRIYSFPPVSASNARILILGSMPGEASLAANQYYAHKRNDFWKIMGELIGASPDLSYPQRLETLKANGIALWDVLAHCEREGSLDSAITLEGVNDFAAFLASHSAIARIYFNGRKAADSFRRFVPPDVLRAGMTLETLPSTSPANASFSFARKLEAWRALTRQS
jgi:hypoxanthine-DNA glycosylase